MTSCFQRGANFIFALLAKIRPWFRLSSKITNWESWTCAIYLIFTSTTFAQRRHAASDDQQQQHSNTKTELIGSAVRCKLGFVRCGPPVQCDARLADSAVAIGCHLLSLSNISSPLRILVLVLGCGDGCIALRKLEKLTLT
jgi:hypothetical protein